MKSHVLETWIFQPDGGTNRLIHLRTLGTSSGLNVNVWLILYTKMNKFCNCGEITLDPAYFWTNPNSMFLDFKSHQKQQIFNRNSTCSIVFIQFIFVLFKKLNSLPVSEDQTQSFFLRHALICRTLLRETNITKRWSLIGFWCNSLVGSLMSSTKRKKRIFAFCNTHFPQLLIRKQMKSALTFMWNPYKYDLIRKKI